MSAFRDSMTDTTPSPPCDYCQHQRMCAVDQMACFTFAGYCGCVVGEVLDFRSEPRLPARVIYDQIFSGDEA